jgi:hypothetical protein
MLEQEGIDLGLVTQIAWPALQEVGGPRLPRLFLHGGHCACGYAVHSKPGRSLPPARRVRVAGVDRRRDVRAGTDPCPACKLIICGSCTSCCDDHFISGYYEISLSCNPGSGTCPPFQIVTAFTNPS